MAGTRTTTLSEQELRRRHRDETVLLDCAEFYVKTNATSKKKHKFTQPQIRKWSLVNQEVPGQTEEAQGALEGERRGRPHVRLQGRRPDYRQSVRGTADQQVSQ